MAEMGNSDLLVQVLELEGGITIHGPAQPVGIKDVLFDDLKEHPEIVALSLKEIWGMKGSFVDELGCTWVDYATRKETKGNGHCAGEVNSAAYRFPIGEAEHIIKTEVHMRKLDWDDHNISLRGIRIITDKGNSYQAGTMDGWVTTFNAPRESEFFAFRGGKRGIITELSVYSRRFVSA